MQEQATGQDQAVDDAMAEPREEEPSHKKKEKTPNELPILEEDELRKFRKEELVADVANLEGI